MYDLDRFLEAQKSLYDVALAEIKNGYKQEHWIWFIFPQLRGLGFSPEAEYYGITGLDEAKAYLKHPILRKRLIEATSAILNLNTDYIDDFLPHPDNLKLRSSMTLFSQAEPEEKLFQEVLDRFYGGKTDEKTLQLLKNVFS